MAPRVSPATSLPQSNFRFRCYRTPYFRRWLIAQGRLVFDQVTADPDSLAALLLQRPGGALDFEAFGYVARGVWGEKTGLPASEIEGGGTDMLFIAPGPSGKYVVLEPS